MNSQIAQINMIKQQLRTADVLDPAILNLYTLVNRQEFVPNSYQDFAFSDMHIPLPHHQCMLSPVEEAAILQALKLEGKEKVLLVGTGTGFLTALVSKLAKKVISVEYYPDLSETAQKNLQRYNCNNVELIVGDGSNGWLAKAPYDVVIFTSSFPEVYQAHFLQVAPLGKLFILAGNHPVIQGQLYTLNKNEKWSFSLLFETDMPEIIDKTKPKEFVF